jgi:hypothetical protein
MPLLGVCLVRAPSYTGAMADARDAKQVLTTFGGLSDEDAEQLVEAVVTAARAEVLDQIAGAAPAPSSVVDLRALRLRYICAAVGRMLSRREVELLFRLTPTAADSVIRRLQALYPAAVEEFLAALVARGSVTATGTAGGENEGWEIYFPEPAGLEHARQLLDRRRLGDAARVNRQAQTLRVPRVVTARAGQAHDPLAILGLKPPRARRAR